MLVAFRASAVFTDVVNHTFALRVLEDQAPFRKISATGGSKAWFFIGVLEMRPLKQNKRIAYEITAAIVKKVEHLTTVGVATIDFEEIDREVLVDPKTWEPA